MLCAGVDLNPALEAQGRDAVDIATALMENTRKQGGSAPIPAAIQRDLLSVAKILNIEWISRGIGQDAKIICPRSSACPRTPQCAGTPGPDKGRMDIDRIRREIITSTQ